MWALIAFARFQKEEKILPRFDLYSFKRPFFVFAGIAAYLTGMSPAITATVPITTRTVVPASGSITLNAGSDTVIVTVPGTFTGNGSAVSVGASGTYTVIGDVRFSGNVATVNGGAIYADTGAVLDFSGSTVSFLNNRAARGGAIYAIGGLAISSSSGGITLQGNTATAAGSGNGGGALYSTGTVTIGGTSTDLVISGNTGAQGGAIYSGDDIVIDGSFNRISITSNTSTYPTKTSNENDTANGGGGALYAADSITINNSAPNGSLTIQGNTSRADGGALHARNSITIRGTYTNILIDANTNSTGMGGGLRTINAGGITIDTTTSGSLVMSNNSTNEYGGALDAAYIGTVNLLGSYGSISMTGNTAVTAGGGAMGSAQSMVINTNTAGQLTISNNTARTSGGAFLGYFADMTLSGSYGSILVDSNKTTLTGTSVSPTGGAGGGFYTAANMLINPIVAGTIVFSNNSAGSSGGALATNTTGSTTIGGSSSGLIFNNNTASNTGGAIYSGSITIGGSHNNIQITSNTSTSHGGAFFANTGGISFSSHAEITGNKSTTGNGGALYAANATNGIVTFAAGATIQNNTAGLQGGAIWANRGLTLNAGSGTQITGNTAGTQGGAIFVNTPGGSVTLTADNGDIVFSGNRQNGTEANAIFFKSTTSSPSFTLTLNASAGHAIEFHDPIQDSGTAGRLTVNKTGTGTVLFSGLQADGVTPTPGAQSNINAVTTVSAGTFQLDNGAIYGRNATTASTSFTLAAAATLATSGTTVGSGGQINALAITLANGSLVNMAANLTLNAGNTNTLFNGVNLTATDNAVLATVTSAQRITLANTNTFAVVGGKTLSSPAVFNGTGTLVKSDTGTLTLSGVGSQIGVVNNTAGTLSFIQAGTFATTGTFTTGTGATTSISSASQLNVGSTFTQQSGATLNVALGSFQPIVNAATASLNGTLNVSGIAASAPSTASALPAIQFNIIHTAAAGNITGDFIAVNAADVGGFPDYLTLTGTKVNNNQDYNVGLMLTWNAGAVKGNGLFTLTNASDTFTVDVPLIDQSGSTTGWDGTTLTKSGAGTLILSAANTYTGETQIQAGTLALDGTANTIASSSAVTVDSGASLSLLSGVAQRVNNLSGAGNVDLGSSVLTANNTTNTSLSGVINGTGSLIKAGAATLTLTGTNTYSGGTAIGAGTLQIGNGGTTGSITGTILNNGTLAINRSDSLTLNGTISGSGDLKTLGTGIITLSGTNTYAGDTDVQAGTLVMTNAQSIGSGAVIIDSDAILQVAPTAPGTFTFNNALSGLGTGTLQVDMLGNSPADTFAFGAGAGSAFTGTVVLNNSTFDLSGNNTTTLTNATLQLNTGNITTVDAGVQTIGNLIISGGTVKFDAILPGAPTGTINTGNVHFNSGTIQLDILPTPVPLPSSALPLLQQDDNVIVSLVNAATVSGDVSSLSLIDLTGAPILPDQQHSIVQNSDLVATGYYGYGLTDLDNHTADHGLFVEYSLQQVDIHSGKTLTLADDTASPPGADELHAQITGSGNLAIAATHTITLNNSTNNYTGSTTVLTGTLILGTDHALGNTSDLILAGGTTTDINGKTQTVGALHGTAGSMLDLNDGFLTVSNGGLFAGALSGSGTIDLSGGTFIATGTSNTLTATTLIGPDTIFSGLGHYGTLGSSIINNGTITAFNALSAGTATSFTLGGDLVNHGTIQLAGSTVGNILTVGGNYSSNGTLIVNTVLGGDASLTDKLVINGDADGNTQVIVNNVGGLGAQTVNGITIVEVHGQSNGTFTLANRVAAGAYEYQLQFGGTANDQNWYLRSTHQGSDIRVEVPVYMVILPLALEYGHAMIGTLHDRIGETWLHPSDPVTEEQSVPCRNISREARCTARVPKPMDNANRNGWAPFGWARLIGDRGFRENGNFSRHGTDYNYTLGGIQAGLDIYGHERADGTLDKAGIYIGHGQASSNVKSVIGGRAGTVDMDVYTVGTYWTHFSSSGWYTDAVMQGTWYEADAKSIYNQRIEPNGFGIATSLEGGYALKFGSNWSLEPQAQLVYQHISFDHARDQFGFIWFEHAESLRGRLGFRLVKTWDIGDEAMPRFVSGWLRTNIWHEFLGKTQTSLGTFDGRNMAPFTSDLGGTWGEISAGISGQASKNTHLFTTAAYNRSLDSKGREAWSGRLGLTINW